MRRFSLPLLCVYKYTPHGAKLQINFDITTRKVTFVLKTHENLNIPLTHTPTK